MGDPKVKLNIDLATAILVSASLLVSVMESASITITMIPEGHGGTGICFRARNIYQLNGQRWKKKQKKGYHRNL